MTTCLFRAAQCPAVRPRIAFLFRLVAANHRLAGAYYRLVGANHRLAGANEARAFAPRRAMRIPARRVQVLPSTYEARQHQQPTSRTARPGWLLEKCVGRHYIYNMSRSDTGQWREAVGRCALPFAEEAFTIGRAQLNAGKKMYVGRKM